MNRNFVPSDIKRAIKGKKCLILFLGLLAASVLGWKVSAGSDQIPAPPQKQPIALTGGVIHTVIGEAIDKGTILFEGGEILGLGREVSIPEEALVLDIKGKHVYPALIESLSNVGLVEVGNMRETVDYKEIGDINPHLRPEQSVNSDSSNIPVTRANGIGLAVTSQTDGLICGSTALLQLDGWTWEDMTVKAPVGMLINWPRAASASRGGGGRRNPGKPSSEDRILLLEETFRRARDYRRAVDAAAGSDAAAPNSDIRLKALLPVLRGEIPAWIHADTAFQIKAAVNWAERTKVKMVLVGGYDAPLVADLLKEKKIPVILTPYLRLPLRRDSSYDEPYTIADRLYRAGVEFCISGGPKGFQNNHGRLRSLPYHAAMAVAFGLPRDVALKAVTQFPAEILGFADHVGTLETGKEATLIVTDGDPLEIVTRVEMMFIRGRRIDLDNKHDRLYRKYREKYRQIRSARDR